ncbi:hypothetical protein KOW79_021560 [Hemibagrus wyckioides]|uniref:B-cell receptor CD22 first Ig-like domain-containing protein n=1 Tax=Hemibagrus wyckioides TaxID=337641 RepID=A0A9D3S9C6_9TELE|nr:hypothetical protein KOW79_021560 [Hemibagrus wyckioides]
MLRNITVAAILMLLTGLTVIKSVWFIKWQGGADPEDVREDEEYQGRVQYTQSSQNDCSLRITNLRERDAQTYRFRFYTDPTGKYTGEPGVTLSVTAEVWKLHAVWGAAAALVPALLLSLIIAVLCIKRKKRSERDTQCVPTPGDDTYTALNLMTVSPEYDTLQNVASVKRTPELENDH